MEIRVSRVVILMKLSERRVAIHRRRRVETQRTRRELSFLSAPSASLCVSAVNHFFHYSPL
jgi:hypothetical protein